MPLQLELVSENQELLGDDAVRVFYEDGGTIGRSLENDWILPDANRYISGRHATIDYQSGSYYIADVSSNGVYVNGAADPLGNGKPRRLFDGDRIRMGDFEFLVTLDEGEDLEMPPPAPATVVPDHIEQLVEEASLRTGIKMLDEEEISGGDVFHAALFGKPAEPEEKNEMIDDRENPFAPPPTEAEQARANLEKLLDAFLNGLGVDRCDLHPSTDPLEMMENAGKVLKAFIEGTTDLLASRASLKGTFRLDQTTVLPQHNNPLKFSRNTRDSIMQLLVGKEGEYLAPPDAVFEVMRDLKCHHDAVLEAMVSAYQEFADRFDPDELQQSFDRTLDARPLLKKLNQLKYWQLYCDLYPIMTQSGSGRFPHQFSEEFVRAYEKRVADYKRLNPVASIQRSQKPVMESPPLPAANDDSEPVDQAEDVKHADHF